jgi:hypothetical protein
MEAAPRIDVTFDFRLDTRPGGDPDALSPTLRRYHRQLWSKPLPNGKMFELVDTTPRAYLHHSSHLGEFRLSSDTVIPTFRKERRLAHVFEESPEELAEFMRIGYTIGAMMLFPGNQVDRRMTINAARGCHPLIKDRFEQTVECIRRHYLGLDSPLRSTLQRYADFFRLFGDFRGYVEFFLLQDLVADDSAEVNFFLPFSGFLSSPVPANTMEYKTYMRRAMEFINARNRRIQAQFEHPDLGRQTL